MTESVFVPLPDRGILAISGPDARAFLQGLVSNDVEKVDERHAVWAAFLTPQGKYLHDFFLAQDADGTLLLEGERGRLDDLRKRLTLYKLRSKAEIADRSDDFLVAAVFGVDAGAALGLDGSDAGTATDFAGGIAFVDPRLAEAGTRAVLPTENGRQALLDAGLAEAGRDTYDRHRLVLGLPDGSRDLVAEKSILLESGFDELHGVDWNKGCYLGQELTARTKYRGLVKKRLVPVAIDGTAPEPGTDVIADGKAVGEMRSAAGGVGLALLRLDALADEAGELVAGGARLTPRKPAWAAF